MSWRFKLINLLMSLGILAMPVVIFAQVPTTTRPAMVTKSATATTAVNDRLSKLQTKALSEIDRRIAVYNGLLPRLSELTMISTTDKNALIAEATQAISDLTVLKSQVSSATDITSLKAVVKTLSDGYKTFGFMYPRMHLILTADKQLVRIGSLMELVAKIQSQTIGLDVNGAADVGKLIKVLDNAETQLVGMKDKTNKAVTTLVAMKPTTSRSQLQSVRQALASNNGDLGKLIGLIRSNLGSLNKIVGPPPAGPADGAGGEGSASGAMSKPIR